LGFSQNLHHSTLIILVSGPFKPDGSESFLWLWFKEDKETKTKTFSESAGPNQSHKLLQYLSKIKIIGIQKTSNHVLVNIEDNTLLYRQKT